MLKYIFYDDRCICLEEPSKIQKFLSQVNRSIDRDLKWKLNRSAGTAVFH